MPGFLENAASWLDDTLAESDGETVSYSDGNNSISVTAVSGMTPVGMELGDGTIQTWLSHDFFIASEDLAVSGVEFEPAVGHHIKKTIRGREVTFRVTQASDGRCFRFTDPTRETMRVHTKEI